MVLIHNSALGEILEEIEDTQKISPVIELVQLIFYLNPLFKRNYNRSCFDLIEFKDETFYQEPEKNVFELERLGGFSIIRVEKKSNGTSDAYNIDDFDPSNMDLYDDGFDNELEELEPEDYEFDDDYERWD